MNSSKLTRLEIPMLSITRRIIIKGSKYCSNKGAKKILAIVIPSTMINETTAKAFIIVTNELSVLYLHIVYRPI